MENSENDEKLCMRGNICYNVPLFDNRIAIFQCE